VRAVVLGFVVACGSGNHPARTIDAPGYLKGQLHAHSNNSGDSATPPDRVAQWYEEHGFDFIVFTDHNRITAPRTSGKLIAFSGVELTQNLETCDPPPSAGFQCLLHVNALFVTESELRWRAPRPASRLALYSDALDEARSLGGLAQLNHPNFHWAADPALVTELTRRGLVLFELANQGSDVANEGDAAHPSTEAMWDAVLTAGGTLYGTATDDAHSYDDAAAIRARGEVPDVGDRGWVMVHATRDGAAIRDALARGDFYSSTGVVLQRIERTGDSLVVETAGGDHELTLIGSGGVVVARAHGATATFSLAGLHGYVRVDVVDARGRRAWVQPIRL
jgi:hypothetical protein